MVELDRDFIKEPVKYGRNAQRVFQPELFMAFDVKKENFVPVLLFKWEEMGWEL